MSDTTDTRDRVIRVETKLESIEESMVEMKATLLEIHTAFVGARGAKWALMGSLTIIGTIIGLIPGLLGLFNKG